MSHEATMWAVKVRGISCAEARVLWHLADCHNPIFGCYPKQDYLADACEIDERSVRRCLAALRDKGLVNWIEQREGKNRKANRYSLGFEPGFRAFSPCEEAENQADNLSGSSEASTGQEEQFEPDNFDALNRTPESSIEPVREPVIEPVIERERASEAVSQESPKAIERKFKLWYPTYPGYQHTSEDAARKQWFALSDEDRAECIARTPAFIAAGKAAKANFVYPSVYLRERGWLKMDDPKSEFAPPSLHNPFSRPWMALRLAELSKPMTTVGWPTLTAFQKMQMRDADAARLVDRERKARYGWPKVTDMHSRAERAVGMTVPGPLLAISEDFKAVHRDSDLARKWQALHERLGWPWMPSTGHDWLYLPAGEPEAAMADFQAKLNEGKGDDNAA